MEKKKLTQTEADEIIAKHAFWMRDHSEHSGNIKADFSNMFLDDLDLHGVDLAEANFCCTKISSCNFASANLQSAYCPAIDIFDSNFASANLNQAKLNGSKIYSSNFSNTNLACAKFNEGAKIVGVKFCNANLTYTDFRATEFYGVDFKFADLTNAYIDFSRSILGQASHAKISRELMFKLVAFLCDFEGDDPEIKQLQNMLRPFVG